MSRIIAGGQLLLTALALLTLTPPTSAWPRALSSALDVVNGAGAKRLLLQEGTATDCSSSGALVTGYRRCLQVLGLDDRGPPPNKHWVHWSLDSNGAAFAVEVAPEEDTHGERIVPGWAGLGWSPEAPPDHPPQMINSTAVIGYVEADTGQSRVEPYILYGKSVVQIEEDHNSWGITEASMEITPQDHLVMRFRRAFDSRFRPGILQRMITAHHHIFRGWILHNHRAGLVMDVTGEGNMRVVGTRLKQSQVNAHAWCMIVAFGILLPLGIMWARYFRAVSPKWYLLHIVVQSSGLAVALAGFLIAITQFRPHPHGLAHFQLGIAVITISLLQPLNSLPRLTMHHQNVMKNVWWAYLHWVVGRAAVVFAWVNIFLGVGRYRTWFTLGPWADALLGCYFGGIVLVCLLLESRLWAQTDLNNRIENDELSKRISMVEPPMPGLPGAVSGLTDTKRHGMPYGQHAYDPDDELLDQMGTMHNKTVADNSFTPSVNQDAPETQTAFNPAQGNVSPETHVEEELLNSFADSAEHAR